MIMSTLKVLISEKKVSFFKLTINEWFEDYFRLI